MKSHKHMFTYIILIFGLLHTSLSLANCSDADLSCLHPQVIKAVKIALIKNKAIPNNKTDKWFKKNIYHIVLDFMKKRGVLEKYYIDCSEAYELAENDPRTCFGTLDSHITKELWGIEFDYANADEEKRIEFLKKIGIKLQ